MLDEQIESLDVLTCPNNAEVKAFDQNTLQKDLLEDIDIGTMISKDDYRSNCCRFNLMLSFLYY